LIATLAVLIFIALDAGAVVIALLWLSERRFIEDGRDVREPRPRSLG
jgi:hypothetical protein